MQTRDHRLCYVDSMNDQLQAAQALRNTIERGKETKVRAWRRKRRASFHGLLPAPTISRSQPFLQILAWADASVA
jgi:hypothetical protein